jgi:hypothetical protein
MTVEVAQHGLEDHAEAAWQPGDVEAGMGQRREAVIAGDGAVGERELAQGVER